MQLDTWNDQLVAGDSLTDLGLLGDPLAVESKVLEAQQDFHEVLMFHAMFGFEVEEQETNQYTCAH